MKKILIVDDDPNILEIMAEFLSDLKDVSVKTTNQPEKVPELLAQEPFDLMITDMLMPGINGIELTEQVLKKFPHMKVIACSGGGDSGALVANLAVNQAMEFGAVTSLVKPFRQQDLVTQVVTLLKLK